MSRDHNSRSRLPDIQHISGSRKLIRSKWIAPMDRPIISDGAIVIDDGRVLEMGQAMELAARHRDAEAIDLGRSIVLPGLVNPHTHLELSACHAGDSPGGDFGDWILGLRARLKLTNDNLDEVVSAGVRIGIEQCRRFGVTTVGDISQHSHITRPLLQNATLRCVSFGEVLGLAKYRWRFEELLPRALDETYTSERLRIAITPHAPYTVDLAGYEVALTRARERNIPLATHLAETPHERAFLEHHSGLFRQTWEKIGQWEDSPQTFRGGPIDFVHQVGLLDYPTLLAHVNFCDDRELELLSRGLASVVYCPRTHAYFAHPPHRWREMVARGINVAVGTDSCASSPDLNIVDDLRLLRRIAPEMQADRLWELVTIRAARAIWMQDEVGTLTPGKRADFAVFDATEPDPLEAILRDNRLPSSVWFDGLRI